jgi:hypothetical protein
LSDGAKNIGISSEIRRDIEKSILVRQLKNQINNLRNDFADKEAELETLRRNIKSTHLAELVNERDEYYLEVQRLKGALVEVKEELHRERQRREWNTRVAGDASEDLRREVARLSSGYQSMLANISNRASASSGQRPSTTTGVRAAVAATDLALAPGLVRPVSATPTSSAHGGGHSPAKDTTGERQKRPQSATLKNTPLSAYYQADHIPTDTAISIPASGGSDPLDNFGLPGVTSSAGTTGKRGVPSQDIYSYLNNGASADSLVADEDAGIFKVGDVVQGQFGGGAQWYNGTIRGYDRADGTYTVHYDDGDHETHVPLSRIRAVPAAVDVIPVRQAPLMVPTLAPAPASHPALVGGAHSSFSPAVKPKPAVPLSAAPYKVGDKIEALYYKGTSWYAGKIQAVHPASTPGDGDFVFDVAYDDGDRELKVPQSNIRAKVAAAPAPATSKAKELKPAADAPKEPSPVPSVPAKFSVGDKVEGLYGGGSSWYEGKIGKVTPSTGGAPPTYTIEYADGDRETSVIETNIRLYPTTAAAPAPAPAPAAQPAGSYSKGDRVQGYFEDMGAWYDGTVVEENADRTYFVRYDDGDEETNKPASKLRPFKAVPTATAAAPALVPVPTVASSSAAVKKPAPASPPKAAVAAPPASKFRVNDRVEGKYGNGDTWYPAVVTAVTNPGPVALYSLEYDDGDSEALVDDSCIRLMVIPGAETQPSVTATAPAAATTTTKPVEASPPPRKASIVNTNLDSFLNELSDDDDSVGGGVGGLDSGRGVMLRPQSGDVVVEPARSRAETDEGYEEDFDA